MAIDTTNAPDCDHCFLRDACPDAEPGSFCAMWQKPGAEAEGAGSE